MDSKNYASKLERKMIEEFKAKFFDKIGYYPIIVTKVYTDSDGYIPMLALDVLEECVNPHLPDHLKKERITIRTHRRYRELVEVRAMFFKIARTMGYSLKKIGQHLKMDHTTVIHNITTFNNLAETDANFKIKYTSIINHIKTQYNQEVYEPSTMDYDSPTQSIPESDLLA